MPARHPKANKRGSDNGTADHELPRGVHRRSATVVRYLLLGWHLTVFSQTIHYNFVNFDDDIRYNARPFGPSRAKRDSSCLYQPAHGQLASVNNPVTYVDCRLYGLNAGGHHATNVVLHTIAALAVWGAASNDRRTVEERKLSHACGCNGRAAGSSGPRRSPTPQHS